MAKKTKKSFNPETLKFKSRVCFAIALPILLVFIAFSFIPMGSIPFWQRILVFGIQGLILASLFIYLGVVYIQDYRLLLATLPKSYFEALEREKQRQIAEKKRLERKKLLEKKKRDEEERRLLAERILAVQKEMVEQQRLKEQQLAEKKKQKAAKKKLAAQKKLQKKKAKEAAKKLKEQQRLEQQKLLEKQRRLEEKQRLEEQKRLEKQRLLEEKQRLEEQKRLEKQRLEEQKCLEKQRLLEEQKRLEEQQRLEEERLPDVVSPDNVKILEVVNKVRKHKVTVGTELERFFNTVQPVLKRIYPDRSIEKKKKGINVWDVAVSQVNKQNAAATENISIGEVDKVRQLVIETIDLAHIQNNNTHNFQSSVYAVNMLNIKSEEEIEDTIWKALTIEQGIKEYDFAFRVIEFVVNRKRYKLIFDISKNMRLGERVIPVGQDPLKLFVTTRKPILHIYLRYLLGQTIVLHHTLGIGNIEVIKEVSLNNIFVWCKFENNEYGLFSDDDFAKNIMIFVQDM